MAAGPRSVGCRGPPATRGRESRARNQESAARADIKVLTLYAFPPLMGLRPRPRLMHLFGQYLY